MLWIVCITFGVVPVTIGRLVYMVTPPRALVEATHSSGLHFWLGVALKIGIVNREFDGSIPLPTGELIEWSEVVGLFDGADVPNGTPFIAV